MGVVLLPAVHTQWTSGEDQLTCKLLHDVGMAMGQHCQGPMWWILLGLLSSSDQEIVETVVCCSVVANSPFELCLRVWWNLAVSLPQLSVLRRQTHCQTDCH